MASWDWFRKVNQHQHHPNHHHHPEYDGQIEPYSTVDKQLIGYKQFNHDQTFLDQSIDMKKNSSTNNNNFLCYNQSDSRVNDMNEFNSTYFPKNVSTKTLNQVDYNDSNRHFESDCNQSTNGYSNGFDNRKINFNYFSEDESITQPSQSKRRVSFEIDKETKPKTFDYQDNLNQLNGHQKMFNSNSLDRQRSSSSMGEYQSRNSNYNSKYWMDKELEDKQLYSSRDYPYSDDELVYFRPSSSNGRRTVYNVDRSATPMPLMDRSSNHLNHDYSEYNSSSFDASDDDYVEFRPQKYGQKTVYEADRNSIPRPFYGHNRFNNNSANNSPINQYNNQSGKHSFTQQFHKVPEIRITEYNDDESQEYNATIQHLACK